MKNLAIKFIPVVTLITLTGCYPVSSPLSNAYQSHYEIPKIYEPSAQEKATADYGKYPNDYEMITKDYMKRVLKDPESARYRFDKTVRKSNTRATTRQDTKYCWMVTFAVNAKNSYGGYTGEKVGFVCIKDGKVIDHQLYD